MAIPTWIFAMVVVRLGWRFLVVRERKHGQGWYLPAGRVEAGEALDAAAVRETLEELDELTLRGDGVREVLHRVSAGCAVYPTGVLVPEQGSVRCDASA